MNTTSRFMYGLLALTASGVMALAQDLGSKALPAPQMSGGKPLMQALKERRSIRDFKSDALSDQQMSDLLLAAFGINRPEIDHRTAPSAQNNQDVDIYVAMAEGLYVYEAKPHRLRKVANQDVRLLTSGQPFGKVAPVQLVYVSDFARMPKVGP